MNPSLRILVADSDSETRRFYIEAVRPLGGDAVEACDGREPASFFAHAPVAVASMAVVTASIETRSRRWTSMRWFPG